MSIVFIMAVFWLLLLLVLVLQYHIQYVLLYSTLSFARTPAVDAVENASTTTFWNVQASRPE